MAKLELERDYWDGADQEQFKNDNDEYYWNNWDRHTQHAGRIHRLLLVSCSEQPKKLPSPKGDAHVDGTGN